MKAIIFDCDGTLVDSEIEHFNAWKHALNMHGYSFTIEEYSTYVGTPMEIASKLIAKKLGISSAEQLKNNKHNFFCSRVEQGISPIEGTVLFLHKLKKAQEKFNYKLAIASGASRHEINLYLKHLQIDQFFEVIISGKDDLHHYQDPEGINKPKPYIYLETAKRLGVLPSECIAIEDSHPGVMASARAGCFTIAIPTFFSLNHDFSKANMVLQSLKDYSIENFFTEVYNISKIIK